MDWFGKTRQSERKTPLQLRTEMMENVTLAFERLITFHTQGMAFEKNATIDQDKRQFKGDYLPILQRVAQEAATHFRRYTALQHPTETFTQSAEINAGYLDALPSELQKMAVPLAAQLDALAAHRHDSLGLEQEWAAMEQALQEAKTAIDTALRKQIMLEAAMSR